MNREVLRNCSQPAEVAGAISHKAPHPCAPQLKLHPPLLCCACCVPTAPPPPYLPLQQLGLSNAPLQVLHSHKLWGFHHQLRRPPGDGPDVEGDQQATARRQPSKLIIKAQHLQVLSLAGGVLLGQHRHRLGGERFDGGQLQGRQLGASGCTSGTGRDGCTCASSPPAASPLP